LNNIQFIQNKICTGLARYHSKMIQSLNHWIFWCSDKSGDNPICLDGRSGRGDACVGTYIAMCLSKPPREAGIWTAAVTSLKMEMDRFSEKQAQISQYRAEILAAIHRSGQR
jgi:hypothetical protein